MAVHAFLPPAKEAAPLADTPPDWAVDPSASSKPTDETVVPDWAKDTTPAQAKTEKVPDWAAPEPKPASTEFVNDASYNSLTGGAFDAGKQAAQCNPNDPSCGYFASAYLRKTGVNIPVLGGAKDIIDHVKAGGGVEVPREQAKAGDLVYYYGPNKGSLKDDQGNGYHVGVLNADGTVSDSSNGKFRPNRKLFSDAKFVRPVRGGQVQDFAYGQQDQTGGPTVPTDAPANLADIKTHIDAGNARLQRLSDLIDQKHSDLNSTLGPMKQTIDDGNADLEGLASQAKILKDKIDAGDQTQIDAYNGLVGQIQAKQADLQPVIDKYNSSLDPGTKELVDEFNNLKPRVQGLIAQYNSTPKGGITAGGPQKPIPHIPHTDLFAGRSDSQNFVPPQFGAYGNTDTSAPIPGDVTGVFTKIRDAQAATSSPEGQTKAGQAKIAQLQQQKSELERVLKDPETAHLTDADIIQKRKDLANVYSALQEAQGGSSPAAPQQKSNGVVLPYDYTPKPNESDLDRQKRLYAEYTQDLTPKVEDGQKKIMLLQGTLGNGVERLNRLADLINAGDTSKLAEYNDMHDRLTELSHSMDQLMDEHRKNVLRINQVGKALGEYRGKPVAPVQGPGADGWDVNAPIKAWESFKTFLSNAGDAIKGMGAAAGGIDNPNIPQDQRDALIEQGAKGLHSAIGQVADTINGGVDNWFKANSNYVSENLGMGKIDPSIYKDPNVKMSQQIGSLGTYFIPGVGEIRGAVSLGELGDSAATDPAKTWQGIKDMVPQSTIIDPETGQRRAATWQDNTVRALNTVAIAAALIHGGVSLREGSIRSSMADNLGIDPSLAGAIFDHAKQTVFEQSIQDSTREYITKKIQEAKPDAPIEMVQQAVDDAIKNNTPAYQRAKAEVMKQPAAVAKANIKNYLDNVLSSVTGKKYIEAGQEFKQRFNDFVSSPGGQEWVQQSGLSPETKAAIKNGEVIDQEAQPVSGQSALKGRTAEDNPINTPVNNEVAPEPQVTKTPEVVNSEPAPDWAKAPSQETTLYHGSPALFKSLVDQPLYFMADEPRHAMVYSDGGGRGAKNTDHYFLNYESGVAYDHNKQDDLWHPIGTIDENGKLHKSKIDTKPLTTEEANDLVTRQGMGSGTPKKAYLYEAKHNGNILDLTEHGGRINQRFTNNETVKREIGSLDPMGNSKAAEIIAKAKKNGDMDWRDTTALQGNYERTRHGEEQAKAWEIIRDQLKAKGYTGIQFADGTGTTTALFDKPTLHAVTELRSGKISPLPPKSKKPQQGLTTSKDEPAAKPTKTKTSEKIPTEAKPEPKVVTPETKAVEPWQMTKKEYIDTYEAGDGGPQLSVKGKDGIRTPITYAEAYKRKLITKDKYDKRFGGLTENQHAQMVGGAKHRDSVSAAVKAGKPVSEEVLKDYPDLQSEPTKAVESSAKPKPIEKLEEPAQVKTLKQGIVDDSIQALNDALDGLPPEPKKITPATSNQGATKALRQIDQLLLRRAAGKAIAEGEDHMMTLLNSEIVSYNKKSFLPPATKDMLNDYLFGDREGTVDELLSGNIQEEPAPKPDKSTRPTDDGDGMDDERTEPSEFDAHPSDNLFRFKDEDFSELPEGAGGEVPKKLQGKNEHAEIVRYMMGSEPLQRAEAVKLRTALKTAKELGYLEPGWMTSEVERILKNPGADVWKDVQQVAIGYHMARLARAYDMGTKEGLSKSKLADIQSEYDDLSQANYIVGNVLGRAFRARQVGFRIDNLRPDFDMRSVNKSRKRHGLDPMTPKQEEEFKKIIEENNAKIVEHEKTIEELRRKVAEKELSVAKTREMVENKPKIYKRPKSVANALEEARQALREAMSRSNAMFVGIDPEVIWKFGKFFVMEGKARGLETTQELLATLKGEFPEFKDLELPEMEDAMVESTKRLPTKGELQENLKGTQAETKQLAKKGIKNQLVDLAKESKRLRDDKAELADLEKQLETGVFKPKGEGRAKPVRSEIQQRIRELRREVAKRRDAPAKEEAFIKKAKEIADKIQEGDYGTAPEKKPPATEGRKQLTEQQQLREWMRRNTELEASYKEQLAEGAFIEAEPKQLREYTDEQRNLRMKIDILKDEIKEAKYAGKELMPIQKINAWLTNAKLVNIINRIDDVRNNSLAAAWNIPATHFEQFLDPWVSKWLGVDPTDYGKMTSDRMQRVLDAAKTITKHESAEIMAGKRIGHLDRTDFTPVIKSKNKLSMLGGKMAGLADSPFYAIYYAINEDIMAHDMASKELGKDATPAQVDAARRAILDNVSEYPEIHLASREMALRLTLNNPNWISRQHAGFKRVMRTELEEAHPHLYDLIDLASNQLVFVFSKVLWNVKMDVLERGPGGIVLSALEISKFRRQIREGIIEEIPFNEKRRITQMLQKGLTHTALAALMLAASGIVYKLWKASGWGKLKKSRTGYYVDWGDLGMIQTFIDPILIMTTMAIAMHDPSIPNDERAGLVKNTMMKTFTSNPLTSNVKGDLDVISGDEDLGEFAARQAMKVAPGVSTVRGLADHVDNLRNYKKGGIIDLDGFVLKGDNIDRKRRLEKGAPGPKFWNQLVREGMYQTPIFREKLPRTN